MSKKTIFAILLTLIIIIAGVVIYTASNKNILSQKYSCPDQKALDYKKATDTYIQWENCILHEGVNEPCGPDTQFEQWVNKNCGIKFNIEVAY